MGKKVLILSSSPRKGGNSETLAAAFAKGAQEAGNQVETVYLRESSTASARAVLPVRSWDTVSSRMTR